LIIIFLLLGFRVLVWVKNRQLTKLMIPTGKMVLVLSKKQVMSEIIREQQGENAEKLDKSQALT